MKTLERPRIDFEASAMRLSDLVLYYTGGETQ